MMVFTQYTSQRLTIIYTVFFLSVYCLAYGLVIQLVGHQYWNPFTWLRYDSGHYLAIADKGYEFFSCAGKFGYPADAKEWCGNTGWFPGYPVLIALLSKTGLAPEPAAWYLSLFFLICLGAGIARLSGFTSFNLHGALVMSLAATWAGSIYYASMFPVSLLLTCIIWGIYFLSRDKPLWVIIFSLLASLSYSTGFLTGMALGLAALFVIQETTRKWTTALLCVAASLSGLAIYFIHLHLTVGHWNAFLLVQEKYGHGLRIPLVSMFQHLFKLPVGADIITVMAYVQTTLVLLLYGFLTYFFFRRKLYQNRIYLMAFILMSAYFWFPWTIGGNLSRYRSESLLLPGVLLIHQSPVKYKWTMQVIQLFLAVYMCIGFLNGGLV